MRVAAMLVMHVGVIMMMVMVMIVAGMRRVREVLMSVAVMMTVAMMIVIVMIVAVRCST